VGIEVLSQMVVTDSIDPPVNVRGGSESLHGFFGSVLPRHLSTNHWGQKGY